MTHTRCLPIAFVGLLIVSGLMGSAQAISIDSIPVLEVEPNAKYDYEIVPSNYSATVNLTTNADWLFIVDWNLTGIPGETDIGIWNVSINVTEGSTVVWQNYSIDVVESVTASSMVALGLGLTFCFVFLALGLKKPEFMMLAGIIWVIVSLTVFREYGEVYLLIGLAVGMVGTLTGGAKVAGWV